MLSKIISSNNNSSSKGNNRSISRHCHVFLAAVDVVAVAVADLQKREEKRTNFSLSIFFLPLYHIFHIFRIFG